MATPKFLTYFQTFTTNQFGEVQLTGILDIKAFHTVNFLIANLPNPMPGLAWVNVVMGKLSGQTLAQAVDRFVLEPNDPNPLAIRTYSVVGPELAIWLQGDPNIQIDIQAWVFLHLCPMVCAVVWLAGARLDLIHPVTLSPLCWAGRSSSYHGKAACRKSPLSTAG